MGTWMRKIARHETSSVRMPPTAGPTAAPSAPHVTQIAAALDSDPASAGRTSSPAQTAAAPPTAWMHRAASSTSREPAAAATADAAARTTRPPASTRPLVNHRDAYAAGTASSAMTRLNATSTQATEVMVAWNCESTAGRARMTTDESASTTPTPAPTAAIRIRSLMAPRYPLGSGQPGGALAVKRREGRLVGGVELPKRRPNLRNRR